MAANSTDRREVVLKMDGKRDPTARSFEPTNTGMIWRESSYDFWNGKEEDKQILDNGSEHFGFDFSQSNATAARDSAASFSSMEDPPSKLIVFVHRNLTPVSESPTTVNRVSFDPNPPGSSESVRRRHQNKDSPSKKSTDSASAGGGDAEILKRSSTNDGTFSNSSSFERKSHLLKERKKSRLMDPPLQPLEKSGEWWEDQGN
ncbi:hypothetical protein GH714_011183 [Hevea brasiliensis]|uniref:Uncharacterized protein n=1 Tax=Hevea brasiliensis TaxID=3981 RepID=A0A6A6KDF1_HEVBR|nr:hypothetical protein GH714_011183 [Hevea brasiliensis]